MRKYFFVGEKHGTNECPKKFLEIVEQHKITQIALEWPIEKQSEIDQYLSGKRMPEQLTIFEENTDGRTSPAMRELLEAAKNRHLKVHLFDPGTPKERDKLMAENLKKIKGRVAILCGDIHAAKREVVLPFVVRAVGKLLGKTHWEHSIRPCASLLPADEVYSYRIVPRCRNPQRPHEHYDEIVAVGKFTKSK